MIDKAVDRSGARNADIAYLALLARIGLPGPPRARSISTVMATWAP
ncbi:hypothetical protein J7355_14390 [Endozoicomonas sp. G2_2]|nr:hypothetical protein [Endozoicomonas sp. G2_2]MBO9471281.1 hypothetical protein [Endozoicomonas sp. G2_2]